MIAFILNLPARQKFLLILILGTGMFIWLCSVTNLFSDDTINTLIFAFSFGLPFLFLGFSTMIDLNDNRVFLVWFTFSVILLLIDFATKNSSRFLIQRSSDFDGSSGVNSLMSDHSTTSLKSLFVFLVVYWILNQVSKRIEGNFLVNTYRQTTWTNEAAKRKMTGLDVLCNIILYVTVVISVLF
jgi:hypothetical protein